MEVFVWKFGFGFQKGSLMVCFGSIHRKKKKDKNGVLGLLCLFEQEETKRNMVWFWFVVFGSSHEKEKRKKKQKWFLACGLWFGFALFVRTRRNKNGNEKRKKEKKKTKIPLT